MNILFCMGRGLTTLQATEFEALKMTVTVSEEMIGTPESFQQVISHFCTFIYIFQRYIC